MKLSVSIPIYNKDKYLDKCISSIIQQSFNDYELILVDDGSTDASIDICQKWQDLYPEKIRIIKKENSGSLLTRKRCIEESKNEYIYIMDADDYLTRSDAFELIAEKVDETNADIIFFDNIVDNNTKQSYDFADGYTFDSSNMNEFYDEFLKNSHLYSLWNKVFHKKLVDIDYDYDNYMGIVYGTDLFQTIPIISRAQKIVYLKETLYCYRYQDNNNSIVHVFKPQSFITAKKNQQRLEKYAHEYNWNVDNMEEKLSRIRMMRIATAIYKAKLINRRETKRRYEYIKSIGEDCYFRTNFKLKNVPPKKAILLLLTYIRIYRLIAIIL